MLAKSDRLGRVHREASEEVKNGAVMWIVSHDYIKLVRAVYIFDYIYNVCIPSYP